jgi:hypothetical protein
MVCDAEPDEGPGKTVKPNVADEEAAGIHFYAAMERIFYASHASFVAHRG